MIMSRKQGVARTAPSILIGYRHLPRRQPTYQPISDMTPRVDMSNAQLRNVIRGALDNPAGAPLNVWAATLR